MKKIVFYLIFLILIFLSQRIYAQDIHGTDSVSSNKYLFFEKKCDSLVYEINNFEPISGNEEYDLYIINEVLPKTIDYILLIKKSLIKANELGTDIDYEFLIDGLIEKLEILKQTLE